MDDSANDSPKVNKPSNIKLVGTFFDTNDSRKIIIKFHLLLPKLNKIELTITNMIDTI